MNHAVDQSDSPIDDRRHNDSDTDNADKTDDEEDYDDEYNRGEDADQEKSDEAWMEDAVQDLKTNPPKYDFNDPVAYEEFEKTYRHVLDKTIGYKGNILHRLIANSENNKQPGPTELALTMIAKHHPELLEADQIRDNHQTPLYIAVQQAKSTMVSALMKGVLESDLGEKGKHTMLMQRVLSKEVDSETCLHWAIRKNINETAIQDMVSQTTDVVLSIRDKEGHTPLHHAVRYQDCTAKRVATVRLMLRISNVALGVEDNSGGSFYQFHLRTEREFKESPEYKKLQETMATAADARKMPLEGADASKDRVREGPKKVERKEQDPKSVEKGKQHQAAGKSDPKSESTRWEQVGQRDERHVARTDGEGGGGGSVKGGIDMPSRDLAVKPNQSARRDLPSDFVPSISRKLTAKPGVVDDPGSQDKMKDDEKLQKLKERQMRRERREKREAAKKSPEKLQESSMRIKTDIKLHCMRKLSPKDTSRVLYGKNPDDTQICFDFSGPSSLKFANFKRSFDHVQFDEILQYVAFPPVTLEKKDEEYSRSKKSGIGRTDMVEFFEWLRDEKKVKRIVKVIVDDSPKPAHSDEAIVEALSGFEVEELHWLKIDLDPETISAVSRRIREVYLRWSGNNTALRAWSEPEGLRSLQKLTKVYLDWTPEENLESDARTKKNIKEFEARLNTPLLDPIVHAKETVTAKTDADTTVKAEPVARSITVKPIGKTNRRRDRTGDSSTASGDRGANINNHKWLESMDAFASDMNDVWMKAKALNTTLGKPVVVALIDDGVDVLDPSLQGKLFEGKSLSFDDAVGGEPKTNQRVNPYFVSAGGHGTVMANMIFRVCPMAKLYVIRMQTRITSEGNKIFPDSAAAAVQAAVDKGVNIISMSWTLSADQQSQDAKDLDAAIRKANEAKILMFCSSSDGGQFNDVTYPSVVNRHWFFRVGAADSAGNPFSWAGPVDKLDYILPGVDVVKRLPGQARAAAGTRVRQKLDEMKTETGSSVATALAAGLAALLLTCAKMAAIHYTSGSDAAVRAMQEHDNMKTALDKLGLTSSRFLQVWDELNTAKWQGYGSGDDREKMAILASRINSLMPSDVALLLTSRK